MSAPADHRTRPAAKRRPVTTTLAEIVDAALDISVAEGVAGVSFRAIAARLDLAPMSIYRFVSSKDDLLDEMILRVLDRIESPLHVNGDWMQRIVDSLGVWRHLLLEHPGVVQVLVGRRMPPASEGLARLEEDVLTSLSLTGIVGEPAARAFWQIFSHAFGQIVFELPRTALSPSDQESAARDMAQLATRRGFDRVHTLAPALNSLQVRGSFDDSLRVLLRGIDAANPREQL